MQCDLLQLLFFLFISVTHSLLPIPQYVLSLIGWKISHNGLHIAPISTQTALRCVFPLIPILRPLSVAEDPLTPVSDPPENISLPDFIYNQQYRVQKSDKVNSFTCGLTGKSIKASEAPARVEAIAKALSKRTGWVPQQEETEWEKIACIYSINAVSYCGSGAEA